MQSRVQVWAGYVLSVLPALMLLMSAGMKLAGPQEAIDGFAQMGWPVKLITPLGILEIAVTVLYLIPRTAVIGAILVTGYLGGAVATHVRIDDAFVMPLVLGIAVWAGLYLRDARIRELIPLTSARSWR
jgi:hypothetical protein